MKFIGSSKLFALVASVEDIRKFTSVIDENQYKVEVEDLDIELSYIKRKFTDRLTHDVIASVKNQQIIGLLNNDVNKVLTEPPKQLLTWNNPNNGGTFLNLAYYAKRSTRTGEINIPRTKLYTLLQHAYIINKLRENTKIFDSNVKFLVNGCSLYARFMFQIIDRICGVSTQSSDANAIMFALAKFWLVYCMDQKDSSRIDNMARQACASIIPDVSINHVNSHFDFENISDFYEFIELLSKFKVRLNKLSYRKLIQDCNNLYGDMMIMSMDLPQFLILNACSVINLGSINNETRLEKVFGKSLVPFYNSIIESVK